MYVAITLIFYISFKQNEFSLCLHNPNQSGAFLHFRIPN